MKTKHISLDEAYKLATQGPLVSTTGDFIRPASGGLIAKAAGDTDQQTEVNAALLAHAFNVLPEVVEALRDAHLQFEHNGQESDSDKEVLNKIEAVLAKATTVEVPS